MFNNNFQNAKVVKKHQTAIFIGKNIAFSTKRMVFSRKNSENFCESSLFFSKKKPFFVSQDDASVIHMLSLTGARKQEYVQG